MGQAKRQDEEPAFTVDPMAIPRTIERTGSLRIRVTEEEARTLKEAAGILGVTVSEYIRRLHAQALESLKARRGK